MIFQIMVLGDGPTITRRRSPCIVLEGSLTHSPRRVVSYFTDIRYCIFNNNKICFENDVFSYMA